MGIGGISVWQLLIVLAIIVLLFGTKKFSSVGADLGKAVKGFKKAISDNDELVQVEAANSADAKPEIARSDNR